MTCIAAVSDGTRVVMAADSLAVGSCGQTFEVSKLIEHPGGVLVGVAGRTASMGVLRRLDPGEPLDGAAADEWAQGVAEAASAVLLAAGVVDPDSEHEFLGALILAWGGRMWEIETNIALPVTRGYHAVGSGDQVAMGAMFGLVSDSIEAALTYDLEWVARQAIEAAIEHQVDVGGPVVVLST